MTKKFSTRLGVSIIALFFIVLWIPACIGPAKVEQFVEIQANETAFLVPLEGATKTGQKKFFSVDYLNEAKVAAKRVSLPLREHKTGRGWWNYRYIPTMAVIKVDRSPVTREWTGGESTGTSKKNEALWVESSDSIGFGVGVNATAMVKEEDTSTFLYNYAGKPLAAIVDNNVRGKINSILSREFAKYSLELGRKKKNEIFAIAKEETVEWFKPLGITIDNLGLAEGMIYKDGEIQNIINQAFLAEMQIQIETQNLAAQEKRNERNVAMATAERRAAQEFAKAAEARKKQVEVEISKMLAEAKLKWVDKWDGGLPKNVMPDNSSLLFNMGFNNEKTKK